MKRRKYSTSSDDSDDVVLKRKDENAYTSLFDHKWETCEFCDEIFSNRYSILKHNISHIIIPLIKLRTHQCEECLYHFTSLEDLATHISTKHKDILTSTKVWEVPATVKLKQEDNFTEKIPEILQSIIEKQVVVKCEDELKEVFIKCNELQNGNGITPDNTENVDLDSLYKTVDIENSVKVETVTPKKLLKERTSSLSEEDKEPIHSRLLFEEDLEDTLFKDLSADCQVSIEMLCQQLDFNEPILAGTMNDFQMDVLNLNENAAEIIYDNNKIREDTTNLIKYGQAIHYDVLMEPEVCTCRWCGKDFPNRFKLLQHESKHLKVKQRKSRAPLCVYCEKYIAGNYQNLRIHRENKHPHIDSDRHYNTYHCPKCRLKYHNYAKHIRNYHEIYKCYQCGLGFETPQLEDEHECGKVQATLDDLPLQLNIDYARANYQGQYESFTNDLHSGPFTNNLHNSLPFTNHLNNTESEMLLCEMCYSFMKGYIQRRQNYDFVGCKSQVGVQQTCDKCNNKVFEVKVVRRKRLKHKPDFFVREMPKHRKPHITNEMRLKNIQNRFKMLKKINKC